MKVLFVASFAVITTDAEESRRLFMEALNLPLEGEDYIHSEKIAGSKHFGVWPLSQAAEACFGTNEWPSDRPIPQASIEFEVENVTEAAAELESHGYTLLHPARTEPWKQVVARLQTSDGVIIGVCYTPLFHKSK